MTLLLFPLEGDPNLINPSFKNIYGIDSHSRIGCMVRVPSGGLMIEYENI